MRWLSVGQLFATWAGVVVAIIIGVATVILALDQPAGEPESSNATMTPSVAERPFIQPHLFEFPSWFTATPASELGTPPEFHLDRGSIEWHCAEWLEWFPTVGATPTIGIDVIVTAPTATSVVIIDFDIEMIRHRPLDGTGTLIRCGYGGDAFLSSTARFSFRENDSVVHLRQFLPDGRTEQDFAIPDDGFQVDAGKTEIIAFLPEGDPGVYEWSMSVEAIIDQQRVVQQVGSADEPLLSLVEPEPGFVLDQYEPVDWDLVNCRWGPPAYSSVPPDDPREWSC